MRITALRPRVERDEIVTVQMTIIGRSVEDIARFMTNLEETAGVQRRIPTRGHRTEDGLVQAVRGGEICDCPLSASSTRSAG